MDHETINRNLIIILPKQPALDWIISVDPQPIQGLTLEELRQEQEVYLLAGGTVNTPEQAEQWALQRFSNLFATFLHGWFTDDSLWPKRRTRKMFKEWFEVQYHSTIWDLSTDPLEHESWN
ncbi:MULTISPECIES: hypothetical protein [unclassified Pusillimonas]|jgi:hypothetical protein|nr:MULTISPECIES: hypothetical protein [unclassified Pusillimonas]QIM49608.1 hypothetical protein G9Q38_10710 [Pusillimonas sp. DMV24BSW_D]ROT44255.1 hypothetical protein CHR62_13085 [Pusillimonas sp. NJUB218]